ncbi:Hypothetical protein FNO222_1233 [Francisella orientalis]|uniref:Uncharacterized protein n=1 Tax=Francisella orientalis TaxID=299583 RepID=A0ABN4GZH1_9GAMM|nr:hypothetical protein FNO12_1222 [Francisella orientalis FNO12]AKN87354.1 Hypothetical protein FNO24_1224 [Francisella orientalis FNO24]AKN88891.1 Hypothetical protein FNO190_1222 [Francisella orientalis]AKU05650.1 Hypothetical protein FNO01_1222 [Francisella orientalis]QEN20564.1 Hypothetical protein FNO39_1233 [Francisella orientalis]
MKYLYILRLNIIVLEMINNLHNIAYNI